MVVCWRLSIHQSLILRRRNSLKIWFWGRRWRRKKWKEESKWFGKMAKNNYWCLKLFMKRWLWRMERNKGINICNFPKELLKGWKWGLKVQRKNNDTKVMMQNQKLSMVIIPPFCQKMSFHHVTINPSRNLVKILKNTNVINVIWIVGPSILIIIKYRDRKKLIEC